MARLQVWLFVLTCVIYAMATVWASIALPQGQIPSHWSSLGSSPADGWSSRSGAIGFMAGMGVLVGGMFAAILVLFTRFDTLPGLNVPNKEFWTRPENLPEARRRAIGDMAGFGAATMVLMIDMVVQIVLASHDPQGRTPSWAGVVFGAWLLYVIPWTVWMATKRWAIPPEGNLGAG